MTQEMSEQKGLKFQYVILWFRLFYLNLLSFPQIHCLQTIQHLRCHYCPVDLSFIRARALLSHITPDIFHHPFQPALFQCLFWIPLKKETTHLKAMYQ